MIGPKNLDTIRAELRESLEATGEDPIHWLEERMSISPKDQDVLQSLKRLLSAPSKRKRTKKPKATTKR